MASHALRNGARAVQLARWKCFARSFASVSTNENGLSEHLAAMAAFSLDRLAGVERDRFAVVAGGLVRRLAWVHPEQAKAQKAIPVPYNAEA